MIDTLREAAIKIIVIDVLVIYAENTIQAIVIPDVNKVERSRTNTKSRNMPI
jgi:hypothetical protein